jgi:hypothetical protein
MQEKEVKYRAQNGVARWNPSILAEQAKGKKENR